MKSAPAVLFFAPVGGLLAHAAQRRWLAELMQNGLVPQQFTEASELYAHLPVTTVSAGPTLALLAGSALQNATVCAYIRSCYPGVPVASVSDPGNESELVLVLDAGVSLYVAPTAGPMLLLAVVRRLLAIAAGGGGQVPGQGFAADASAGGWRLLESQSVLVAPSGERVELTAIERRALRLLFASTQAGVSHDALLQALNLGPVSTGSKQHGFGRTRLSVMFSRLRRKCESHGLFLPVVSVHGWGYQFTGCEPEP